VTNSSDLRELSFEFANMLANADFRRALRKAGGRNRRDILVAHDNDSFESVVRRAIEQTRPPVLIAIKRDAGFVLIKLEPKRRPRWSAIAAVLPTRSRPSTPPPRITPTTTVGRVYDALEAHERGVEYERWSWFRLSPIENRALTAH
jgi:hypothetical protein